MKHAIALLIKFAMVTVILEIVLLTFTNLEFWNIFWISVTVSLLMYLLGDIIILSSTNNTLAIIADIGLSFFLIYMFNYIWFDSEVTFVSCLAASILLGIGEQFFHKYVEKNVYHKTTYA